MKVLLVNGSQHPNGCTYTALEEVAQELQRQGIETEHFWCGNKAIMGCVGCGHCSQDKRCWNDNDTVNNFLERWPTPTPLCLELQCTLLAHRDS